MLKDIINVKDYHLPNRCVYSGEFDNYEEEPYGWGIMKYPDGHEAIGTFIKIPNGVAYINYGNYMQLGFFLQGRLNGWGIQMGKGTYNFGYYKDGVLVKDCTDEIFEQIHSRIVENSRNIQSKTGKYPRWAHAFPSKKEVFFGLFEKGYKMIGFRFLPSGDVYAGMSNYTLDITGTFTHIKGTSFQSGVFENGALIQEAKGWLFHISGWVETLNYMELQFKESEKFYLDFICNEIGKIFD